MQIQKPLSKGFIVVASLKKKFLNSAIFCAESLKEFYPDAQVTLFTNKEWVEPFMYDIFDDINTDGPDHVRMKLWALSRTPYDLTAYLDADVEIVSEEIKHIFDHIDDETDIVLTKIRPYNSKITKFPGGELTDHCGLFLYRKTDKVIRFMQEWWDLYLKQRSLEWEMDYKLYPPDLRKWDQWTFWWLQNKTEFAIVRKYFPEDARWNFINGYKREELDGKSVIIYHHTLDVYKR